MSSPESRANDIAIEALKQALSLASLILGLTVTFIKDIIEDDRNLTIGPWLVPLAWFLLAVAIWTAWVSIAHAARTIGNSTAEEYVFKQGFARRLARVAQWTFCGGLSCLALFGVLNYQIFVS